MRLLRGFWTFFVGQFLVACRCLLLSLISLSSVFAAEPGKSSSPSARQRTDEEASLNTYLEGIAQRMSENIARLTREVKQAGRYQAVDELADALLLLKNKTAGFEQYLLAADALQRVADETSRSQSFLLTVMLILREPHLSSFLKSQILGNIVGLTYWEKLYADVIVRKKFPRRPGRSFTSSAKRPLIPTSTSFSLSEKVLATKIRTKSTHIFY